MVCCAISQVAGMHWVLARLIIKALCMHCFIKNVSRPLAAVEQNHILLSPAPPPPRGRAIASEAPTGCCMCECEFWSL